jgi:hypothetical protein
MAISNMTFNPFQQGDKKPPALLFLEAVAGGYTDKAAAGIAGWTLTEASVFIGDNGHDYEIADNKRQHTYEEHLMSTGRGIDIARVALRQETRSWVQKAEPTPVKIIEDYID